MIPGTASVLGTVTVSIGGSLADSPLDFCPVSSRLYELFTVRFPSIGTSIFIGVCARLGGCFSTARFSREFERFSFELRKFSFDL